ncbi:LysR family transcriptional regulator [Hutsoniella sourekii]|uniref:LysR family transcriptional regulator n=1 Tax=Hutsoniella sourekii TaxID=87650 RepID=UPI0004857CBB|nr:LysR family transcriptional regulator [Hutsoniella sourekii]
MNLDHLKYFLVLAENEHYTRSAQQLKITQPALSYALKQIEDELGVKLFEHKGRNIQLTEIGNTFYESVSIAIEMLEFSIKQVHDLKDGGGHINIGLLRELSIESVPGITRRFLDIYTGISVDFDTDSGLSKDILQNLLNRRYHVAFCSRLNEYNDDIVYVPIKNQNIVLITPLNHPLATRQSVKLADTIVYGQIFFSKDAGARTVIEPLFKQKNLSPNVLYELNEDQSIAGLVSNGFGIAIMPHFSHLDRFEVAQIPIDDIDSNRYYYFCYLKNTYQIPAVQKYISFIEENFSLNIN